MRRVLAASSAAFLRRCRSGGTGSRVSPASVEAVRVKITFRRFGFAFDDCSHPHPTSTSSDNGSRLPLTKLFSPTSESFGHKINKSSRFLSVLQVVRFPSELSRIGYIFTLSADTLRPYSNWRTTETSEQYRSGNELIRRCSSLPQPVASQIRRASRGKMKRVLCAAVFSCASSRNAVSGYRWKAEFENRRVIVSGSCSRAKLQADGARGA